MDLVACLPEHLKHLIDILRASDTKYKKLDDSVLYAIYSARNAVGMAGWKSTDNFGINIGSSRGATSLFEQYHEEFLENNKTATLASPTYDSRKYFLMGGPRSTDPRTRNFTFHYLFHGITCGIKRHRMVTKRYGR